MRGKVFRHTHAQDGFRITPAYAGKSRTLYVEAKNYEDHPRLCGEKQTGDSDAVKIMGSPPPMRGKGEKVGDAIGGTWITPAYAGKSSTILFFTNCL